MKILFGNSSSSSSLEIKKRVELAKKACRSAEYRYDLGLSLMCTCHVCIII